MASLDPAMNSRNAHFVNAYMVSENLNDDEQEQVGEEPEVLVEMDVQRRLLQMIQVHLVEMKAFVDSTVDASEELSTICGQVRHICRAISNDVKDISANVRFICYLAALVLVLLTTIVAGVLFLNIYVLHSLTVIFSAEKLARLPFHE
jgi:hypothetical protein